MTANEKYVEAHRWNDIHIGWLIDYMEKIKSSLEVFEALGREAADYIDSRITELECLRSDYTNE